ncbi:hypothetical protein [Desulfocastanea catecholica]
MLIHAYFKDAISRRSLQHRLARFVAEGRIVREGKQREIRSRLAPVTGKVRLTEAGGDLMEITGEMAVTSSSVPEENHDKFVKLILE